MRVIVALALSCLVACSGISQGGMDASGAGEPGGTAARAGAVGSAGSSGAGHGGAGGSAGQPVAAAGHSGEAVAEAGQPSEAGAGGEGGPLTFGGAAGAASGGLSGSGGSGGATELRPECQPSNTHALPWHCAAPQPVNCNLITVGSCTGYGDCPEPENASLACIPYTQNDWAMCKDGRVAKCDADTCGTDAGFKCTIYEANAPTTTFCPCVFLGVTQAK